MFDALMMVGGLKDIFWGQSDANSVEIMPDAYLKREFDIRCATRFDTWFSEADVRSEPLLDAGFVRTANGRIDM